MTNKLQYPCLAKRYFSAPNSNNDKPNTTEYTYTPTTTTTTTAATPMIDAANSSTGRTTTTANTLDETEETAATATSTTSATNTAANAMDVHSDHSDMSDVSDSTGHESGSPAWRVVFSPSQSTSSPNSQFPLIHRVDIQWKTRLDPLATYLDTSLYSPIIYQFEHELELDNQHAIILVRPFVVYDDEQDTQVFNKNKQVVLKGDLEIAMTAQKKSSETTTFKGHSKIQFTDSSYHHDRKAFRLVWKYYTADTQQLIYSTISTPFRVFARKPTKKEKTESTSPVAATTTTSSATSPTSHKKKRKEMEPSTTSAPVSAVPTVVVQPTLVEPEAKKVKREVIQIDEDDLTTLNIRAVPTFVQSVTSAVVSHLISQKENTNQDLVMELFKTLKDINCRLERLEKMSNPPTTTNSNPEMMETSSTANRHHHQVLSNLQHV